MCCKRTQPHTGRSTSLIRDLRDRANGGNQTNGTPLHNAAPRAELDATHRTSRTAHATRDHQRDQHRRSLTPAGARHRPGPRCWIHRSGGGGMAGSTRAPVPQPTGRGRSGCGLPARLPTRRAVGLHPSGLVRLDPVAARFAADGLSPKDHGELLSDLPVDLAHHLGRVLYRPTNPVIRTVTPAFSAVARAAASAAPSPARAPGGSRDRCRGGARSGASRAAP